LVGVKVTVLVGLGDNPGVGVTVGVTVEVGVIVGVIVGVGVVVDVVVGVGVGEQSPQEPYSSITSVTYEFEEIFASSLS
jgi:hypothetical protein